MYNIWWEKTTQSKEWFAKYYGTFSPSYTTVEFERARTCTDDTKHSGRPNEAVTKENIQKAVLDDRKVDDSKRVLALLQRNPTEFFCQFVTMDEIGIHYYIPEFNKQSAEW